MNKVGMHVVRMIRRCFCTWYILGDFAKAFPWVWREDLLCLVGGIEDFRGGCYALTADVLRQDTVAV